MITFLKQIFYQIFYGRSGYRSIVHSKPNMGFQIVPNGRETCLYKRDNKYIEIVSEGYDAHGKRYETVVISKKLKWSNGRMISIEEYQLLKKDILSLYENQTHSVLNLIEE